MFGLTDESEPVIPEYAIVDNYGVTYIDCHYRNEGVDEGWLEFDGFFYSETNVLVMRYRPV